VDIVLFQLLRIKLKSIPLLISASCSISFDIKFVAIAQCSILAVYKGYGKTKPVNWSLVLKRLNSIISTDLVVGTQILQQSEIIKQCTFLPALLSRVGHPP
jgi:hypothetical protein